MELINRFITIPISDFFSKNYLETIASQTTKVFSIGYNSIINIAIAMIMMGLLIQGVGLKDQGRKVIGLGVIEAMVTSILKLAYEE